MLRNSLMACGAVLSVLGAILIFTSGDTISIILEVIGIALGAVSFFLTDRRR